jgi:hypothetical protein
MWVPMDDYGFTDCGFIKIEVEGHEEAVHDGAVSLIATQRPTRTCRINSIAIAGFLMRRPLAGVPAPKHCFRPQDSARESETPRR